MQVWCLRRCLDAQLMCDCKLKASHDCVEPANSDQIAGGWATKNRLGPQHL